MREVFNTTNGNKTKHCTFPILPLVVSIKGGIFSGARQHTLAALGSTALHLKKNPPFNTHLPSALNT